jgi:hypothetical protein
MNLSLHQVPCSFTFREELHSSLISVTQNEFCKYQIYFLLTMSENVYLFYVAERQRN